MRDRTTLIIGAGPAGLTAAHELASHDIPPLVLEQGERVGGISRTEEYKGYLFDIGGHRFYTKVGEIEQHWRQMMGADFRRVPRLSRIYYRGKFYKYPLELIGTLMNLGPVESVLILISYIKAKVFQRRPEVTFEDWVVNRFGRRLFEMFFRTYTEKVWGIPVDKIQAEWAAQRIQDLSLVTAVLNALLPRRKTNVKTLIEEFEYPKRGPGMMWQRFREAVENQGGKVQLHTTVDKVNRQGNQVTSVVYQHEGASHEIAVDNVISTMPLRHLINALSPAAPTEIIDAANNLNYRDFVMVGLIVNRDKVFADNWIYVHAPNVRVGRIQNFKNWSIDMVVDPKKTSVGMEYFCSVGDDLWRLSEPDFIKLASEEFCRLGFAEPHEIEDGFVIRQLKAYPVYDETYRKNLDIIKAYLSTITNLQTIGRNGLHRYNNQDHSMLTGLYAARNLIKNKQQHDVWEVNTERSYHETFVVEETSRAASTVSPSLTEI